MKRKKISILLAIMLIAMVGFVSCSKDDDDKKNDPNDTNNGSNEQTSNMEIRVTENGEGTVVYKFDAQNRLTSINTSQKVMAVTYPSTNTIRFALYSTNDAFLYTLNDDGHVVREYLASENWTLEYEYDNGYLKKMRENATTITCTWENGNLKSQQSGTDTYTYSYGTILDKGNIIAPWMWSIRFDEFVLPIALLGKTSQYLVSSVTFTSSGGNKQINYRYETDTSGRVTKVYKQENGGAEKPYMEIQYR